MNGKELKVAEYNLSFGSSARMVNVFGVFRYIKNNGLYVIYGDISPTQPIVYYGTSHVKENTILSMTPKPEDEEIIKKYIFKVTEDEDLKEFEIISLESIETIEIIASNHLEVKPEIINSLMEKTIPKKEAVSEEKETKKTKKKNKMLIPLILILAACGAGYYYFTTLSQNDNTVKAIVCQKETNDDSIGATIETTSEYHFNNEDILENVETTQIYNFLSTDNYEDFINKGLFYKYMPDDENGGFKEDKENNTITYVSKEYADSNYSESTNYEEIIFQNKRDGYACEEKILK